ncbi:hypothetical protein MSG28_005569 [Choristoneura fumiferana]|uniref:Uncharacterized protein n=1 Tax=Choristoneura fumiferana TaxID=7141 RepID=A0ACC0L0K2_CHOFU|nr:hypothetical protein MSG28_005569 [Choristoneura fumiferana]
MGIIEMYQTVDKGVLKSRRHEMRIFPRGPKIEFPQFTLLSLPGVLVMESLLYVWMNSYFMKAFRTHDVAMQSGLTEEEIRYTHSLLRNQYRQLGKITFHDIVLGPCARSARIATTILLANPAVKQQCLHCCVSVWRVKRNYWHLRRNKRPSADYNKQSLFELERGSRKYALECPIYDSYMTKELEDRFLFHNRSNFLTCRVEVHARSTCQSHLVLTLFNPPGGSCMTFEVLKLSGMCAELGRFLRLFGAWPPAALALVVILFCKVFTEFADNSCVVHAMLPEIARLSVASEVHPHYLMLAATLASSLPCHLVTGTPANAMVSQYVHIPPWRMLSAGVGPMVIASVVPWFTVSIWSKAVWADVSSYPPWAREHII